MSTEEMLCRWAEQKYGLPRVLKVEFEFDEGWGGTDITPGDPARIDLYVTTPDKRTRVDSDLEFIPALIREIVEFSLGHRA
jgi:hypothetical protein